ncbi:MAG: NAD(+) diphosphatase [Litoreibacter sp.]
MKNAEMVTFGGSGLDRAAHLRRDSKAITDMKANPLARAMPFWRGKPLVVGEDRGTGGWLKMSDTILSDHPSDQIFLGIDEGAPRFAQDVSAWEPPEIAETVDAFLDPSEQHHPSLPKDHVFAELRSIMSHLTPRDAELIVSAKAVMNWHALNPFCSKCGQPSNVALAGWQRVCPSCDAYHFPRTDPVVIMLITHGNSCLMGRSPNWPDGMYSCLAGFIEPGETIEAAVRRETFEETGVHVGQVNYLASQPWPFPASLMMGCHGEATSTEITVDPHEIEDAMWVTREEMMETFAGDNPKMKPAREGAIAHFLLLNWIKSTLD